MIILDTQPISQWQLGPSEPTEKLLTRLQAEPEGEVGIAIISPYEQLRECLGNIHSNNSHAEKQHPDFLRLEKLLDFYSGWRRRILPFDGAAAAIFNRFPAKLRRSIGPMDSRIAAIVLANQGMLNSANLHHSSKSPDCMSRIGFAIDGQGKRLDSRSERCLRCP
jgi:hypothetical protein